MAHTMVCAEKWAILGLYIVPKKVTTSFGGAKYSGAKYSLGLEAPGTVWAKLTHQLHRICGFPAVPIDGTSDS